MKSIVFVISTAISFISLISADTLYKYNGINEVIINTPSSLAKRCIPIYSDTPEYLYFDENKCKEVYGFYFKQLNKYSENYSLNYRFYNAENSGIAFEKITGFEIEINAKLNYFSKIKKEIYYEIER